MWSTLFLTKTVKLSRATTAVKSTNTATQNSPIKKHSFFSPAHLRFLRQMLLPNMRPVRIIISCAKPPTRTQQWKKAIATTVLILACGSYGPVYGLGANATDSTRYTFDIPSLKVEEALSQLAKQTGHQLLFSYALVNSHNSTAVKGEHSLTSALQQLLESTPLTGNLTERGVIIITDTSARNHNGKGRGNMNSNITLNKRKTLLATFVAMFAAGATTQGAMAQTDSATAQSQIDEIIVTATKRETSLQDTSMSISVLSGKDLEDRGVLSISNIISTVPGVSLVSDGPGFPDYIMRGVASSSNSGLLGNRIISVYLDETSLPQEASDVGLVDVSRVELLKGPQGTLYGKSAMGGVVRYITNEPTTESFSGGVSAYGSNTSEGGNNVGGSGYMNIPLTDNLAARVMAYNFDNDGFVDADGADKAENINTSKTKGGRLALKWDINELTSLGLTYLNQKVDVGARQMIGTTFTPFPGAGVEPPDLKAPSLSTLSRQYGKQPYGYDTEVLNLKFNREFKHFSSSVVASRTDQLFSREEVVNDFVNVTSSERFIATNKFTAKVDTFEARLVSNSEDGAFLDWIVGFWYEDSERAARTLTFDEDLTITLFGISFLPDDITSNALALDFSSEKAIYGEVALHMTDKTTLTLGYRRSDVERDVGSFEFATGKFDVFAKLPLVGITGTETQEDVNTYKVELEYAFNEDILLYTLASSGYRSGGFNANSLVALSSTYESDTLWNYELGVKASWLEDRLTTNGVIYRIDWDDMQLNAQDQTTFINGIRNVGKAQIQGVELELNYLVRDDLRLGLNYAFTDATLEEDFVPNVVSGIPSASAGERLPGSARDSYALFVDWQRPLTSELDLVLRVTHRYIGDRVDSLGGDGRGEFLPSYELTDLRAGVEHANGLTVSVFADNVFNDIAITRLEKRGRFFLQQNITRPRTVGINVGYRF